MFSLLCICSAHPHCSVGCLHAATSVILRLLSCCTFSQTVKGTEPKLFHPGCSHFMEALRRCGVVSSLHDPTSRRGLVHSVDSLSWQLHPPASAQLNIVNPTLNHHYPLCCRSAASAEELYLSSGLFLAETVQHNREQRAQQAADQQQPSCSPVKEGPSSSSYAGASTGPAAATATGDAGSAHGDVQVSQGPPSIKTSVPEAAAAEPAQPGSAADASGGQSSAAGGVPSAARQLFGSLLPFGSSGLTSSQQERPQSANKAAAAGASTSLYAYGAVSSLSGSSTPTAASAAAAAGGATMCSPRNLAAAAGSAGLLVNTGAAGGSSSHHSGHHFHRSSLTSTPTAAAAAAAAAAGVGGTPSTRTGQHHRTSGGTSDAASRTPAAPSWPASPPAAGKGVWVLSRHTCDT